MFALAVYLQPVAADTGWSHAAISSAMTLVFIVMGVSGFFWGAASDRFGARPVVLAGAAILGIGLIVASQARSVFVFQIAYGILVGIAAGAFVAPIIATTSLWFDKHVGLAVSLVTCGFGVAPLTLSPLTAWLITEHGWRSTMFTIGVGAMIAMALAALFIRRPPQIAPVVTSAPIVNGCGDFVSTLRSPKFLALAGAYFFCCAAHSGPIFHTISYAMMCGVPTMAAVSIYSIEGLAGFGGRLIFGIAADKIGVKQVLIAGLLMQAIVISLYVHATKLPHFYALAVLLGTAYSGVMPLYAVLARSYFSPSIMGGVLGAATMASCFGMSVGPVAGGWLFDQFGDYTWLYLGSAAVGLAAAAIALAFPKLQARAQELAPAPA
jgi:MFS family permease